MTRRNIRTIEIKDTKLGALGVKSGIACGVTRKDDLMKLVDLCAGNLEKVEKIKKATE